MNALILELRTRSQGGFDEQHVLGVLMSFDSEESDEVKRQLERRKLADYPFVVVMAAGVRNLKEVIDQEQFIYASQHHHIQAQIKLFAQDIMSSLQHVHMQGYAHGDVKPKNILRMQGNLCHMNLNDVFCLCVRWTYNERWLLQVDRFRRQWKDWHRLFG